MLFSIFKGLSLELFLEDKSSTSITYEIIRNQSEENPKKVMKDRRVPLQFNHTKHV